VPAASAGQSASFALKKVRRKDVRKGMVVLPKIEGAPPPKVHREFVAEGMVTSITDIVNRSLADECSAHIIPRNYNKNEIPGYASRRPGLADVRDH
jgi:GTPase